MTTGQPSPPVHPAVRVGHIHLRVADLDRAICFYRDALGFRLVADAREQGLDMALLAAGDYHHHIALNTWSSAGGAPAPRGCTGLEHVAFLYPSHHELVRATRRLLDHGRPVDHVSDHGATIAVYLSDPDGNGIELAYDRPVETWWTPDGRPTLRNDPVDIEEFLRSGSEPPSAAPGARTPRSALASRA